MCALIEEARNPSRTLAVPMTPTSCPASPAMSWLDYAWGTAVANGWGRQDRRSPQSAQNASCSAETFAGFARRNAGAFAG